MAFIVPFSHTKIVGPTGRFGARYGMGVRRKVLQIEVKQRGKHRCPRCGYTFAGGAWMPQTIMGKTIATEAAAKQGVKTSA